MPHFIYRAKKENAETVVGEINAHDADEAVNLVSQLGLLPISVQEGTLAKGLRQQIKSKPIRSKELFLFTRQLASLIKSGVSLLRALDLLARQTRNRNLQAVLMAMSDSVRNGQSFSTALANYPHIFSDLYVVMVRAGEESGQLRAILVNVADYYRKQDEISAKVKTALAYPFFMLAVGILTVCFILTYVMPRVSVLFDGIHAKLPWPTVFIMKTSEAFQYAWPAMAVLVFLGVIFLRSSENLSQMQKFFIRGFYVIPFIKGIAMKTDMERFSRTMGLLLKSGIPILEALEISIPVVGFDKLRQGLLVCHAKVEGGMAFGEALQEMTIIPDMFAYLILIGEETGALDESLQDMADAYEQEIAETTKVLTTLLEPAMILVIGLVVGFIVFAMLMPVFQMDVFS